MLRSLFVLLALLLGMAQPAAPFAGEPTERTVRGASVAAGQTTSDEPTDTVVEQLDVVVEDAADAPLLSQPAPEATVPAEQGSVVAVAQPGSDRVLTEPVDATGLQTVGVTWPQSVDGTVPAVQVRSLDDGRWGSWQEVPVGDEAPDPGTADSATARAGTQSVYVGSVDAVQFAFADETPQGTQVALVGSPETTATVVAPAAYAATTGDVPTVVSRAVWGAAPAVCTPDVASRLVGAVLHHTADRNTYTTQAEAMQMIRNDQAYHINGRGWCDIGYNFVVDKWGTVYEGRANSLTQAVVGVHAGGFNTGTVGVAMLGTYDNAPSTAVVEAVGRLIGFRLGTYGVDPSSSMQYTTGVGENSRFQNTTVTLPRIFGHRDVAYTACPGNGGYSVLPAIRVIASNLASTLRYGDAVAQVTAIYHDMLGRGPDEAGLQYWATVAMLRGPGVVANSFARSEEYVRGQVVEGYRSVLGRDPSDAEAAYWTGSITSGAMPPEVLRGYLAQGDEFWSRGGGTPQGFVTLLYDEVLDRAPSPDEMTYWLARLTVAGRGQVAVNGLWRSVESGGLRVDDVYGQFLGRGTDPGGRDYWARVWVATGDDALRSGIVSSQEYLDRAHAADDA